MSEIEFGWSVVYVNNNNNNKIDNSDDNNNNNDDDNYDAGRKFDGVAFRAQSLGFGGAPKLVVVVQSRVCGLYPGDGWDCARASE